jgi:hypothetical protein
MHSVGYKKILYSLTFNNLEGSHEQKKFHEMMSDEVLLVAKGFIVFGVACTLPRALAPLAERPSFAGNHNETGEFPHCEPLNG